MGYVIFGMDGWWQSCWTLLHCSNYWLTDSSAQVVPFPYKRLETASAPKPTIAEKWSLDATEAAVAVGRGRGWCMCEAGWEGMTLEMGECPPFLPGHRDIKTVLP